MRVSVDSLLTFSAVNVHALLSDNPSVPTSVALCCCDRYFKMDASKPIPVRKSIPQIPSFNDFGSFTQNDMSTMERNNLDRSWSVGSDASRTLTPAQSSFRESLSRVFLEHVRQN
jgi:hypothetical protein